MLTFMPTVTVRVTCADIPGLLAAAVRSGMQLRSVKHSVDLTAVLEVQGNDLPKLRKICARMGADLEVEHLRGGILLLRRLLCRPVLLTAMSVLVILTLWLPTRVLFIEVEGNGAVPSRLILEKAELCGISFGASR